MIELGFVSESQADKMRLAQAALCRKGVLNGMMTAKHAAGVLGCGEKKARKLLKEMTAEGQMRKDGANYWVKV